MEKLGNREGCVRKGGDSEVSGLLYSVEDVLETLVRDLQESRGQGMC